MVTSRPSSGGTMRGPSEAGESEPMGGMLQRRPGPRHHPASYALRGCHDALLTGSIPALASCSQVTADGGRWLVTVVRGHLGDTRLMCVGSLRATPALLRCLPSDAEPGRNLGPGVTGLAQADHGSADGLVQLGREPDHVGQGVNVASCNSPRVRPHNASNEPGVLVVLDRSPSRVWCQPGLDTRSPAGLDSTRCLVCHESCHRLLLPPRPPEGVTAWGLHPIGAEVVEPGVEVKLRLLDPLECQRLRASWLCSCGGGRPKDHAFSRCLTGVDGVIRSQSG